MGIAWIRGRDSIAVCVLSTCLYFDPQGVFWGACRRGIGVGLWDLGKEGVLSEGELFEFGGGVEEFAVRIWG